MICPVRVTLSIASCRLAVDIAEAPSPCSTATVLTFNQTAGKRRPTDSHPHITVLPTTLKSRNHIPNAMETTVLHQDATLCKMIPTVAIRIKRLTRPQAEPRGRHTRMGAARANPS
jgi:hypothetical protein